jgi:hypothetical protein
VIALYVDEDSMHSGLLAGLRARGFDVLTTTEAAIRSASDEDQLDLARERGRALLTANVRDFARLHRECLAAGRHHPGITVRPRAPARIGDQIEALVRLASEINQEEMTDRLEFLANWVRPRGE